MIPQPFRGSCGRKPMGSTRYKFKMSETSDLTDDLATSFDL
jgi:hypothetical protein